MQITDLQPDDTAAIEQAAQALVAGFREQAPDAWPDLIEARSEVQKALEPGKVCRVARDADGTVLGWIGGQHSFARVWELHPLVVVPSAQRRGIGRALVAATGKSPYRAISDQAKLGTIRNKGEDALALAQSRFVLSSSQETKWTTSRSRRCP